MVLKFDEFINQPTIEDEHIDEGKWLNRAAGLTMGIASILGGHGTANAQQYPNTEKSSYEQVEIKKNDVKKFIKFWKEQGYTHNGVSLDKLQNFVDKMMNSSKNAGNGLKGTITRNNFAKRFLTDILFKTNDDFISTSKCDGKDINYIINNCSDFDKQGRPLIGFVTIEGEDYFVNIGNLDHWDGL